MRISIILALACALVACSDDSSSNNANNANNVNNVNNSNNVNNVNNVNNSNNVNNANNSNNVNNTNNLNNVADMGEDTGPPVDPLDGIGQPVQVDTGYQFTEGPRWFASESVLRFTDIPANTIFEVNAQGQISEFRNPSGNANGLAFDSQGALLAAEHGNRRVSITVNGNPEALTDNYNGDAYNSPNDLVVASDGTVYFTDPPYGLGNRTREINFNGLFRYEPSNDSVTAEWEGATNTRPNGVNLSPDESVLYLADTAGNKVMAFDVAADGSLSNQRDFVDASGPDGMAVDSAGNLYITTGDGVDVVAPDGTKWGTIELNERPSNCAFGGADGTILYVTAQSSLYSVQMVVPGLY